MGGWASTHVFDAFDATDDQATITLQLVVTLARLVVLELLFAIELKTKQTCTHKEGLGNKFQSWLPLLTAGPRPLGEAPGLIFL